MLPLLSWETFRSSTAHFYPPHFSALGCTPPPFIKWRSAPCPVLLFATEFFLLRNPTVPSSAPFPPTVFPAPLYSAMCFFFCASMSVRCLTVSVSQRPFPLSFGCPGERQRRGGER
eukprot:RCo021794